MTHGPARTAGSLPARRSLRIALLLVVAGTLLGLAGGRMTWATVTATADVGELGASVVGEAQVTGDDLAAVSGISLIGLVAGAAVAGTRGRGRWVVGAALVACGLALAVTALTARAGAAETALDRAATGNLEAVPATASLEVTTTPAGAVLATLGGLALAAAGAEAVRRGPAWPALGDAFRAPGDRRRANGPHAPGDDHAAEHGPRDTPDDEPPWQGD